MTMNEECLHIAKIITNATWIERNRLNNKKNVREDPYDSSFEERKTTCLELIHYFICFILFTLSRSLPMQQSKMNHFYK